MASLDSGNPIYNAAADDWRSKPVVVVHEYKIPTRYHDVQATVRVHGPAGPARGTPVKAASARHGSGLGLNGHAPTAVSGGGVTGGGSHFAPVNQVRHVYNYSTSPTLFSTALRIQ